MTESTDKRHFLSDEEVKQCQLRMLDIMDEFCKEHHLCYWLAYGSLIGAVRHQGYIPWDDDLDLCMPLSHYLKFLELAASEEGQAFFRQLAVRVGDWSVPSDIPYHQSFAKLYDERTRTSKGVLAYDREGFRDAVFVDIFPIIGLQGTPEEDAKLQKLDDLYRKLRYASEDLSEMRKREGRKRYLQRIIGYLPACMHGYKAYLRAYNELRNTFCDALECATWIVPDADPARYQMGLDVKTVRLSFEGRQVPAPENYDAFLRGCYGDYMQLPPEDQRVPSHAQDFWWAEKELQAKSKN